MEVTHTHLDKSDNYLNKEEMDFCTQTVKSDMYPRSAAEPIAPINGSPEKSTEVHDDARPP